MLNKEEYVSNKIKLYYQNKYKEKSIKSNRIKKRINNRKSTDFGKIYDNITSRINKTFSKNNIKFTNTYQEILGCSIEELKIYIFSKLKDNMNINNYGEWEIDHIIPVSVFDFTINDNIYKCFHYSNLQPLWKHENRVKYNHVY